MAHEVESLAYANEAPWHGLGTKVPDDISPDQMLIVAGLDWKVEKHPSYVVIDNEAIPTGQYSLVRSTDKSILTNVSEDWNPLQNHEAFEFFNDFVSLGNMKMESAGSLKNGQMVFALAKINDGFSVFGEDDIESYLLFSNPHQYGKTITVKSTMTRVVCMNTITAALNTESKRDVKINHCKKFNAEQVKMMLGMNHENLVKYKEMAEFLGSKKYNGESVKEYFNKIFPVSGDKKAISKNAELALTYLETQPGHDIVPGTWWNAFNAITYMSNHVIGRNEETRKYNLLYGNSVNLIQQAANEAIKFAEAA